MHPFRNPLTEEGTTSLNIAGWTFNSLVDGTMRGLFSMLFGAGVILLTSRAEARGRGAGIGDIYYRRLLWLLLFGVIHQYVILWGDILFTYAVAGMFLFPLRRLSPRTLAISGLLILATFIPKTILWDHLKFEILTTATQANAREAAGKTLTEEEVRAQEKWSQSWLRMPDAKKTQKMIEAQRSGYWANLRRHANFSVMMQSQILYSILIWDALGMMLLGMALVKVGVFSAERSTRFYVLCLVIGYGIGMPLRAWGAYNDLSQNFDRMAYFQSWSHVISNMATYEFYRLFVVFGHIGLIVLVHRSGRVKRLTASLAAVGRMALTNYVMQSVIVTLLLNGYGLGLYGHVQRYQTFFIVFSVWALQLILSPIWLKYFRFGPLEWLWRSLTYWQLQPMAQMSQPLRV